MWMRVLALAGSLGAVVVLAACGGSDGDAAEIRMLDNLFAPNVVEVDPGERIKLPVGEPVRAYVLNMTEFDPMASFHLHAETFAVYPAGMGERPASFGDVVTLGQTDRAILEFRLSELGRYMFHPHQHAMAARGAMGWFAAV